MSESADLRLRLFTSDLNRCSVESPKVPIVIVNALHHAGDMHAALEAILARGPEHVFFVEPTDNFLVRFLARKGFARRVEYSGLTPGRLGLKTLRAICGRSGYRPRITTMWIFPEDLHRQGFNRPSGFRLDGDRRNQVRQRVRRSPRPSSRIAGFWDKIPECGYAQNSVSLDSPFKRRSGSSWRRRCCFPAP